MNQVSSARGVATLLGGLVLWPVLAVTVWSGFGHPDFGPSEPTAIWIIVEGGQPEVNRIRLTLDVRPAEIGLAVENIGEERIVIQPAVGPLQDEAARQSDWRSYSYRFEGRGDDAEHSATCAVTRDPGCLISVGSGDRLIILYRTEPLSRGGSLIAARLPPVLVSSQNVDGEPAVGVEFTRGSVVAVLGLREDALLRTGLAGGSQLLSTRAGSWTFEFSAADLRSGRDLLFESTSLARLFDFMAWLAAVLVGVLGPPWMRQVWRSRTILLSASHEPKGRAETDGLTNS